MNFNNDLKPVHLLWPILVGFIAFSASVIFLNSELEWHDKKVIIKQSDSTYYSPNYIMYDNEIGDTLFTPFSTKEDSANSKVTKKKIIGSSKSLVYNRFPLLLVWIMSVGVLIGFGFSFIPVYIAKIKEYGFKWQYFIVSILIIGTVFIPQYIGNYISGHNLLIPRDIENIFGIGFSECALKFNSRVPFIPVGFWIVAVMSIVVTSYNASYIKDLLKYKSEFELFFIIIAISLGLSIFSNNIMNTATNQILNVTDNFKILPHEFAYINAIIYSFVLLISYIFIGGYFNTLVEKMSKSEQDINIDQKGKSFFEYVGIILSLLAPIIGSGIADILKILSA